MLCKATDCERESKHRGFCQKHYEQVLKYGKPIKTMYDSNDFIFKGKICLIVLCDRQRRKTAEAVIDSCDYEKVKDLKWSQKEGYAFNAKYKISLARFLVFGGVEEAKGKGKILVDHKSGDTLDNRRENLRKCSVKENNRNRIGKTGKEYKGACYYPYRGKGKEKWLARIRVDNQLIHLGYFDTPEQAALVYNRAAKKYFGNYAKINEGV